jgi:hypothetical protein
MTGLFTARAERCKVLTGTNYDKSEALMDGLKLASTEEGEIGMMPLSWTLAGAELQALPVTKQLAAGKKLIDALCFIEGLRATK